MNNKGQKMLMFAVMLLISSFLIYGCASKETTPPTETQTEETAPTQEAPKTEEAPAPEAPQTEEAPATDEQHTQTDKALPSEQKGDAIASVNGVNIYRRELDRALNVYSRQNKGQLPEEQIKRLQDIIVKQLIENELLFQEGKGLNITPTDTEINARLEQIKKQYPSEKEFVEYLAQNQISEEDLKRDLGRNFVVSKVIQNHLSSAATQAGAEPKEEELKKFYEAHKDQFKQEDMVKASHILIKLEENADEKTIQQAKEKITQILDQVKKGGDFAQLAKENSQCPSAANGGDLGFFSRNQMVPEFSQAAFSLKPGEMSDVVRSKFGFHIIKVTETKPASEVPYEEAKERIKQYMAGNTKSTAIKDYIQTLRTKADIKTMLPSATPQPETPPSMPPMPPTTAPAPSTAPSGH